MTIFIAACGSSSSSEKPGFFQSRDEVFHGQTLNQAAKFVERENLKALSQMATNGLDLDATGEHGFNLLYWAMRSDEIESFEKLLMLGADPDQAWEDGDSVTYASAGVKDSRYLELVLKYGADPNLMHANSSASPLFNALEPDDFTHMNLLIDAGADVNKQNKFGETPAVAAAALNYYTIVDYLLKNGTDHCIKNRWGYDLFYELGGSEQRMNKKSKSYQIVLRLLKELPPCE